MEHDDEPDAGAVPSTEAGHSCSRPQSESVPAMTARTSSRSTPDAALHLAIGLYLDNRVTLGQGAAVAGIPASEFLAELGMRKIPIHYDVEDALADIATAAKMAPR
jgi:predicted HTH domain antitoxin